MKHKVIVGVVYRPPGGSTARFNDYLYDALNKISLEGQYCYVMGDFNIDLCKTNSSDFVNNIVTCGFSPTINKPTRVTSSSASLIDNIITNVSNIDSKVHIEVSGILVTDVSDHFPIFTNSSFQTKCLRNEPIYIRNYADRNIQLFVSRIEGTDWCDVYQTKDTSLAFNTFIQTFLHIYEATFPITVLNKHKRRKRIGLREALSPPSKLKISSTRVI